MSNFTKAVEHYLEGLEAVSPGACPGCTECGLENVDTIDDPRYELAGEPSLSKQQCDSCGSTLGGDRHPAHGIMKQYKPQEQYYGLQPSGKDTILHLDVCGDCVMYLANGEEPEHWE